jgi:hypothetical protein
MLPDTKMLGPPGNRLALLHDAMHNTGHYFFTGLLCRVLVQINTKR